MTHYRVTFKNTPPASIVQQADLLGLLTDKLGRGYVVETLEAVTVPDLPFPLRQGLADETGFVRALNTVAKSGDRISAIRLLRAATGWGLRDAKEYVDFLMLADGDLP